MKLMKMPKKNGDVAQRAWSLLRLSLLWTRKGGVLRRRLMMELRLVPKFLKSTLGQATAASHRDQMHYKERELSFDETPIFHVKMHRPASMRFLLPCITPEEVDFDYDFGADEDDGVYGYYDSGSKKSYSTRSEKEEEQGEEKEYGYESFNEKKKKTPYPLEEEGIDSKAEKFIAKFYEQMKLQRQISYLEYTEMLNRGAS